MTGMRMLRPTGIWTVSSDKSPAAHAVRRRARDVFRALVDHGADDLADRKQQLPRPDNDTTDDARADFAEVERNCVADLADACVLRRMLSRPRTHAEHEAAADTG